MTTIVKTYGIHRTFRGRYAVTTDISDDLSYYDACTTLTYATAELGLRKAEAFVRLLYKDFVDFRGEPIHFEYRNMGLVP